MGSALRDARAPLLREPGGVDGPASLRINSGGSGAAVGGGDEPKAESFLSALLRRKPIYVLAIALLCVGSVLLIAVALRDWETAFSDTLVSWPVRGVVYTNGRYCQWVKYDDSGTNVSLSDLHATGASWMQLRVTVFQESPNSTKITSGSLTASDYSLEEISRKALAKNMHVALLIELDLPSYASSEARSTIGQGFDAAKWDAWFESYSSTVLHYAQLAEEVGMEMLAVGWKLPVVSKQADRWRALVNATRGVYSGNLTYAAGHSGEETAVEWWDAVDYIGVEAFYPIGKTSTAEDVPTDKSMAKSWKRVLDHGVGDMDGGLLDLHNRWNKTILFTSIGYCSGPCPLNPNKIISLKAQAARYQGFFDAIGNADWFHGAFFFNWITDPFAGGQKDYCMTPHGKPAEDIVRNYFGATTYAKHKDGKPECGCVIG